MTERPVLRLAGVMLRSVVYAGWFSWPVAIDWNHRAGQPSAVGWIALGIWFPIALVLVVVREQLVREARRRRGETIRRGRRS